MRHILSAFALLLFLSASLAQNKPPGKPHDKPMDKSPAVPTPGRRLYIHYCGSCHGADGRGMGPAAGALKSPPPDLTTLAQRHGGKFPYEYVETVLRFGTTFTAHGSPEMPVWGPIFGAEENYNEVAVRERIKQLCDYLASLQQKES